MLHAGILLSAAACLAAAGSALAQSSLVVGEPRMLRDADGKPVLVYGAKDPDAHLVVTQESFGAQPVVVAKQPAVRDSSGHAVLDGAGRIVVSQAAAPMSEEAMAVYQVDRYLLVPSSSAGASAASPSITAVPAPRPVDPSTE